MFQQRSVEVFLDNMAYDTPNKGHVTAWLFRKRVIRNYEYTSPTIVDENEAYPVLSEVCMDLLSSTLDFCL